MVAGVEVIQNECICYGDFGDVDSCFHPPKYLRDSSLFSAEHSCARLDGAKSGDCPIISEYEFGEPLPFSSQNLTSTCPVVQEWIIIAYLVCVKNATQMISRKLLRLKQRYKHTDIITLRE